MNHSQVTQEQEVPTETGWAAIRKTWSSRSRWEGLAVAAVPPVAFAVLSTAGVASCCPWLARSTGWCGMTG